MRSRVAQLPLGTIKATIAPSLEDNPTRPPLTVAGLFAGIGGIELGLSRSGHHTRLLNEIEDSANAVLDAHFPESERSADITKLRALPAGTELVTAGFPCQDLSQAGLTRGIEGARSGLVEEVFRLLEKRPVEWVLLENVPFMLQLGRGRALEVILSELERLEYQWAYRVVNSRAFGVPQRRERVYFLASRRHDPRSILFVDNATEPQDSRSFPTIACGFYWTEGLRGLGWAVDSVPTLKGGSSIGIPSPPAIIFPSGRIAKPNIRDAERMQGFSADWTKPAEIVAKPSSRWKLVGNAVTVDVAEWIGRRLLAPGTYDPAGDIQLTSRGPWPNAAYNVGKGRYSAALSSWPRHESSPSLEDFLQFELDDLSPKATAGFLSRAREAKLRFPPGFLDRVESHLIRMNGASLRAIV
jgi:DNA (cytosine-5)-methyltransferase 1